MPELENKKSIKIFEGVYEPNEKVDSGSAEMYIHEFIKRRGNFNNGEPPEESIFSNVPASRKFLDSNANEVDPNKKLRQKEQKLMHNYPKDLASKYSTRNSRVTKLDGSDTPAEPGLKLSANRREMVNDLVEECENKMTSNVNRCFVAKQKYIESMMDKGYYIDFPQEFKWDSLKTKDGQFVNRLNNANIGLLTNDLEMLC